ncbi:integrase catalytic domain-containing protein [Paraburkholderia sp. UCT2]|uniref:integrase catalytic domain-containing protein n=1 Tax=Paraburkholderia sp. UCT2 TaxID=2615208 RepID=UPI001655BFB6|nr:DDE-type integrase/transposase/recombinase [Paraburkholderia sp. UCT2]MBC8732306.1 transposase family protein [Paraburkholderia sp. UCT2]
MHLFSATEMYDAFDSLDLPARTRAMIVQSFRRPARTLLANRHKAPAELCCPKMGLTIQVANSIERAAANSYLFDDSVLGYLDSPFELHVQYEGKKKRPVQFNWMQGFLVMTDAAFYVDDWYSPDQLISKCKSNPSRFVREGTVFRSPPLEAAASSLRLIYRLRNSDEIDPITARNHGFLRSFLVDGETPPSRFQSDLRDFFKCTAFSTLEELKYAYPHHCLDSFLSAIARGDIVADFSSAFVTQCDQFLVFRDIETRELYRQVHAIDLTVYKEARRGSPVFHPGSKVLLSGNPFTVVSAGKLELIILPDGEADPIVLKATAVEKLYKGGQLRPIDIQQSNEDPLCLSSVYRNVSTSAIKDALHRLELLDLWEQGIRNQMVMVYSDRTYRTFKKMKRDALLAGTDLVAAFISQTSKRGNRTPRLDVEVEKVIKEAFENKYETLRGRSKWSVYGDIGIKLEAIGKSISKQTFLRRIARAESVESIRKREGEKAAYQAETFVWVLHRDTPSHGEYSMQFVHIDHTELEIEIVYEETGESLGRPYLTLIICAFSRRVLGFYVSLKSPRYISCMAAILDMVRRNGRVPENIIFDGGKEFGALDFKSLLCFLRINENPRKTSACRDGSVLERVFGMTQAAFIHQLFGNTKLRRNVRQLTGENDPSRLAIHTLDELYEGLERYFFEVYDQRRHGTLLIPPRQKFEVGLDRGGQRLGRLKRLEDCIPHAFPTVKGFTRTIDYQRGVRYDYSQYRNPRLEYRKFDGMSVETKYHPIDPEIVYTFVEKEWYPMFRVSEGVQAATSRYSLLAAAEERKVLHCRTLKSQADANIGVSEIIADLEKKAMARFTSAAKTQDREAYQGPTHCFDTEEYPRETEGGANQPETTEQTLERLRSGGYHGTRY